MNKERDMNEAERDLLFKTATAVAALALTMGISKDSPSVQELILAIALAEGEKGARG